MRLHYLSIVLILFISVMLYSCIEEPTISEVKRPYSSLRLGNFSRNVETLNIEITNADGTVIKKTVNKNQMTTHFDIASGTRAFVVKNGNGDVLIQKNISVSSYEEITLLFSGTSKPGDDFYNTFGEIAYSEGDVYVYNGPKADTTAWLHYFDFISEMEEDGVLAKNFIARCVDKSTGKFVDADEEFSFNIIQSLATSPGEKRLLLLNLLNPGSTDPKYDTLGKHDINVEGGKRHYLFITGSPIANPLELVKSVESPLPVRSK
ncbi:MAG: hypothetical protein CVV23_14760 [Ignavibacteriae bacterium HGW-Ignavibacteriae-2]|nr:MAG: hypothetical protein CVV23_14760 [Ignavibacteriae bacterium HGW-Ignavibacteriae-2]